MEPFATPEDVAAVFRPLSEEETVIATGLLLAASIKLRVRVPSIDERIEANPIWGEVAKYAVVAAVKRVLQNPENARQKSETTGPFTTSITVDSAVSSGALYLDERDLEGLVSSGGFVGSAHLRMGLA